MLPWQRSRVSSGARRRRTQLRPNSFRTPSCASARDSRYQYRSFGALSGVSELRKGTGSARSGRDRSWIRMSAVLRCELHHGTRGYYFSTYSYTVIATVVHFTLTLFTIETCKPTMVNGQTSATHALQPMLQPNVYRVAVWMNLQHYSCIVYWLCWVDGVAVGW